MRTLIGLVDKLQPATVLEAGCGEGLILRQLNQLWPTVPMHGLDIDTALLAAARQISPHASYIEGSVYNVPAPTGAYDVVICTEVLEHLDSPHAALEEIARVARSHCLFSVPREPLWRIANIARGSYVSELGNTPGHINHWNSAEIVTLVGRYLDIVAVRRPFPWTMILAKVR